jgi:hypothetical protein
MQQEPSCAAGVPAIDCVLCIATTSAPPITQPSLFLRFAGCALHKWRPRSAGLLRAAAAEQEAPLPAGGDSRHPPLTTGRTWRQLRRSPARLLFSRTLNLLPLKTFFSMTLA